MSKVRARPESGKLYFDFHYRGERCREYSTLSDSAANRKKMEAVLKKIESEISLNTFDYARYFPSSPNIAKFADAANGSAARTVFVAGTPLFRDFVETWKSEKKIEWRHAYIQVIDSILGVHLLPAFGDIEVAQIDRASILQFRAVLGDTKVDSKHPLKGRTRKSATVNRIVAILRQILDEAAARHGFTNPATTVKRLKTQKEDIQPFTMNEVTQLIDSVRVDYKDYFITRFFTGLRTAEAHGLKWKHVDLERGLLLIRETFYNGRTEYTKNDGSQRDIQMSQPVMQAITHLRPSKVDPEGYVFRTKNGHPIDNKNLNDRIWKPLLRLCGVKYRRPYQMRHTCATLWLAAGENPQWIANQLGHTTTEMLFRNYGRYVPNLLRQDGTAFDRLVSAAVLGGVKDAPTAGNDSQASSKPKEKRHAG